MVGLIGLNLNQTKVFFASISSFNLLLTFVLLSFSWKDKTKKWYLFIAICFLFGIIAEWIGVHTGLLFGQYTYGPNLGFKVDGIPLIIGVNWVLLVFASQSLVRKWVKNPYLILLLSASMMTLLDVFIEPIAVDLDYWQWDNMVIPLYNYICWFFVSIPMHLLYHKMAFHRKSSLAENLFFVMALFFILLNVL